MKSKILQIILIIILGILLVGGVIYAFIINKNKNQNQPAEKVNNHLPIKGDSPSINKDSINNLNGNTSKNTIEENKTDQPEEISDSKLEQIELSINTWIESKDEKYLIDAISKTTGDSEESYELWRNLVRDNSKDLVALSSKIQDKSTLKRLLYIYDWFVNLSGDYEKLSPEKKQEILRDYTQVDLFFKQISQ